ncbi:matrix-remodeling-associated protein 7 isoform X2 [Hyla sarda]|uniref:matrix-remodeling-associated protein 7 isoform X2 n=1 Tax=Hyla sarda TaxID=327740 RepID=UPI0024C21D4C|nr:matrix-remodeling-associated protein 7 isoform X2 [Hyla sarda]
MEQAGDFSMTIPLIVTALAVILATLIVKLRSAKEKTPTETAAQVEETLAEEPSETEEIDKEEPIAEDEAGERTESDGAISVEEVGAVEEPPPPPAKEHETQVEECAAKERTASSHSSQEEEEDSKEEDFETESDKVLKISEADDADDETLFFKYLPGKLRGSDFEKMLTKDELEEEQRAEDDKKLSLQSS